ncbi:MAG: hypothetical protein U5Q44_01250 [Dehalococcoidia bacterium]|nr:hypothetical protein [Dehalococcoidia bacterium]
MPLKSEHREEGELPFGKENFWTRRYSRRRARSGPVAPPAQALPGWRLSAAAATTMTTTNGGNGNGRQWRQR